MLGKQRNLGAVRQCLTFHGGARLNERVELNRKGRPMSYQDNCARCGESYDSENLMTCKSCRGDVCYRCFGRLPGLCTRCSPEEQPPPAPVPVPAPAPASAQGD